MSARQPGIIQSQAYNGRYSDVVNTSQTWTLYDWLTFADAWFFFICMGLEFSGETGVRKSVFAPPLDVTRARNFTQVVHRLHKAVSFFVRVQPHCTMELVDEHHYYLLEYARVMEHNFGPGKITSCNLHTAVCRLAEQCRQRGHSGYEGELWIERSVQVLTRSIVQSRAPPEQTMAVRLANDDATMNLTRDVPEAIDLAEDLPMFCRDKQDTVYI